MPETRTRPLRRARQRAVEALQTLQVPGVHIRMTESKLLATIENTGFVRRNEKTVDFLTLFADVIAARRTSAPTGVPQRKEEYKPERHLRQADIDAQPRQVSMGGIGIGEGVMGQNIQRGRPWR